MTLLAYYKNKVYEIQQISLFLVITLIRHWSLLGFFLLLFILK